MSYLPSDELVDIPETRPNGTGGDDRYRCLFDNNIDAVFSLDREGRFLEANAAAERLSGYGQHELRSMDFADLCVLEDRHKAMFFFARAMSGASRSIELSAICRDGSCVDLYLTGAPIIVNGAMTGIFCTARDITRKRRAEAQLRRARRDAEQAKDRFLSVLSHELRTPLMPVLTTVQMLEKQPGIPADLHATLAMMRRNLELEARLIDDLLDLNRIRQGKLALTFQNVNLHEKLQHVVELCRSEITEKGLAVEVAFHAQDPAVTADSARIAQVLWNIVGNAVKFTPAGGSIKIVTCNGKRKRAVCVGDCSAGQQMCKACQRTLGTRQYIAIHVTDTGAGITEESMRHLFDAFDGVACQGRHGSGRGISLSISKALVELHGGKLLVHSSGAAKGTTFTVILPVRKVPVARRERITQQSKAVAVGGRNVLLVEDHPDTARALSRLLSSTGLVVQVADSVQAACALADKKQYDLLISDIGLPDGTGIDVIRYMQKERAVPAIALSGYGMEDDVNRSREAGFAEHLVKPINIAQLQETIGRLLSV